MKNTTFILRTCSINSIFSILLLISTQYCVSSQKESASTYALTNVCPNFGILNSQDENFKKAIFIENDTGFEKSLVAIKNPKSGSVNYASVSIATEAKSINKKEKWNNFKSQYKYYCSDVADFPNWYIDNELKFKKENIIFCSNKELSNIRNCLSKLEEDNDLNLTPLYLEVLNEENVQPLGKWHIVDFIKNKNTSDSKLNFKLNLYDARERIKIEDRDSSRKVESILISLKKAEEIDSNKFQTSLNFKMYSQLIKRKEELKTENLRITELEKEISDKKKESGICVYSLAGEFKKIISNIHILDGSTMWYDSISCESQKISFNNNYAGIVQKDFFGLMNPDKNDYISPSQILVKKAYLQKQVKLTNGINIFVFTKTPPPGIESKEAAINKLVERKKLSQENIKKGWTGVDIDLSNLDIKIEE